MAAGPEAHPLRATLGVGAALVVQALELRDVDQEFGGGAMAGEWMGSHRHLSGTSASV